MLQNVWKTQSTALTQNELFFFFLPVSYGEKCPGPSKHVGMVLAGNEIQMQVWQPHGPWQFSLCRFPPSTPSSCLPPPIRANT